MKKIKIGNKTIGNKFPTFIIAEAGVNHNGSINIARKLIDVARDAGADAVKFQTFKTDEIVTKSAPKANYQIKKEESSQYKMMKKLELSNDDFIELSEYAEKKNIIFLSSPFDTESVDLLDEIDVSAFKIGSGEITNFPLLDHVAGMDKPIILSTGMATICEIEEALNLIANKTEDVILMHCVTSYPAKIENANLNLIKTLQSTFKLPVGYSDHTIGYEMALAAVAMGGCIIEKHFTLDRNQEGPDHKASMEPEELQEMIRLVRNVEKGLGDGVKRVIKEEQEIKKVARKSVVAKVNIPKGNILKEDNITIKRPGTGIEPKYFYILIGKTAKVTIKKEEVINWDMLK
jgi:N,N'-diacetyllegionaminate synthase